MDGFGLDISSILTGEEAEELFREDVEEQEIEETQETETQETEQETGHADDAEHQEEVDVEEDKGGTEEKAVKHKSDGSSPNPYSSIARALKNDGIFSDTEDDDIDSVKGPEDFAELFEKVIDAKLGERQKRINEALNSGVEPSVLQKYEQTIQYLESIDDDAVSAEGDEGDDLRRQLIFNDLINKGFSEEKARRATDNSFKSGSDVDDAIDALEGLKKFYGSGYKKILDDSKAKAEAAKRAQKEQAEQFRKMVIDDEVKIGATVLDKRTKQKVYESVITPSYKDPDTGQLLTAVQKFQKENPLEFLKQLGMWYVLTDGGKNTDKLMSAQLRTEKNKSIRELERKINSSSFNSDGTLKYAGGENDSKDILLSDDWKIG